MNFKKIIPWILCTLLITATPVQATGTVDDLENATSDLESELSNLNTEMNHLESELDEILHKIQATASDLEETKTALAIAKGLEEAQYESMKLRIKYMYENGNSSIMEMFLSSGSLAEFLHHAEYYSSIMEYDRSVLEEYQKNQEEIVAKEQELAATAEYLLQLQSDLQAKEDALAQKISNTSADLSVFQAKLEAAKEEAKRAEEAAKEEVIPIPPAEPETEPEPETVPEIEPEVEPEVQISEIDPDLEPEDSDSNETNIIDSVSDLELLAGLLECEAGYQDYEGLLAVGSVVVNRMNSSYYPDTLRGVIFQSGQFPPATNGKLETILERGVKDLCLQVAQDALNGKNNVGDCLQFRSKNSGHVGTVIGNNVFF